MSVRVFLIPLLTAMWLSSCYSYKIYPKADRKFTPPAPKEKVYVENPGLTREYKILKHAGIYFFTADSTDLSAAHIRLKRLTPARFVCANPLAGWAILLGQYPCYLPDNMIFAFEKTTDGTAVQMEFTLEITTRYWFWDIFARKNYSRTAGQALAIRYYK